MQPVLFEHYALIVQVHVTMQKVLTPIGARVGPPMASVEALVGGVWRIVHELVLELPAVCFAFKIVAACSVNTIHFFVTRSMVHKRSPRWYMLMVQEKGFLVKPLLDGVLLSPLLAGWTGAREGVFALVSDRLCSFILA